MPVASGELPRDRLIIVVDIKEGYPSPLAVFAYQVKTVDGGNSYEIGDQVEVDLLNGTTTRARVKEIFKQDLVSLCTKRYVQVHNGDVVPYDRTVADSMVRDSLARDLSPGNRIRVSLLSCNIPPRIAATGSGAGQETKLVINPAIDAVRILQRQRFAAQAGNESVSAAQTADARLLLKEPNKR